MRNGVTTFVASAFGRTSDPLKPVPRRSGICSRAASLLLVFVLAKAAMLAGHHVPLSWWSPVAYLWQDAIVVLAFAAVEFSLAGRRRIVWAAYTGLVLYAAINVPIARALSTPLTRPMLRAA